MDGSARRRLLRPLAPILGAAALLQIAGAWVLCVRVGWSWDDAFEAFVVTNSAIALSFAVCGSVIAFHRPRNPIGWLFLGAGLAQGTTALMAPVMQALHDAGAPLGLQRLAVTLFGYSWPWAIGLFIPLALILFPDGRPPSPRWRAVVWALVVTAPLFVLSMGADPSPDLGPAPTGYLTLANYHELAGWWTFAEVRGLAVMLLAFAGLLIRYRRADETGRRQLLWVLLGTIAFVSFTVPWAFVAGTPVGVLLAIPLVPASVAVAIVRHQLLDIRLVVSRALAFVLLSVATVLVYLGLVAILDRVVSDRFGGSAVATALLIVLMSPLLPRAQRLVDRAMYGDRRDPAKVASQVGEELLAEAGGELSGVAEAVRRALRLPYVAIEAAGRTIASAGKASGPTSALELGFAGRLLGLLVVGLRPGEDEMSPKDRDALALVAAPLAVAIHATGLSEELQASRELIVAAREEERRRLRRDLHDGLGPTLTGMALAADAAANLVETDAGKTRELLDGLRRDGRQAVGDIRRLVDNLRPPALDELGLIGALRQRAEQTVRRTDGGPVQVEINVSDPLPPLPAAIEVAAFRITTEALNNVVRHSQASKAVVRLTHGAALEIEIIDNGRPVNGVWRPGVGLEGMRERAAELGGTCEAGPTAEGARVCVSLPLGAA